LITLKLDAFWLYGHSMGGSIAIETAGVAGNAREGTDGLRTQFSCGWGNVQPVIAAQTEQQFLTQGYDVMLSAETTAWAGCLKSNAPYAVWRGASSLVEGVEPEWEEQFLSLPCPVTLIFGELSLPDGDVDNLQQKGVEVKIIPAAGHSMSWENPSALAQTLAGYGGVIMARTAAGLSGCRYCYATQAFS
jgi:pimeloyl-ACP methyl ester carboxylesterase